MTDHETARFWRLYLVLGGASVALYPLVPAGPVRDWIFFDAIAMGAAAAVAYAGFLHRPRALGAWLFIAAGQLAFALGDGLFGLEEYVLHNKPFPSIADVFYLAGYPLSAAGLRSADSRSRSAPELGGRDRRDRDHVSLTLASWLFLMGPIAHDRTLNGTGRLISLAYPLGDVLLLATALRITMGSSKRPPAYWLLGAGVVSLLVADSAYLGALQLGDYKSGDVIDLGWLASYVLFGTAALHPSMTALSLPSAEHLPRLTRLSLLTAGRGLDRRSDDDADPDLRGVAPAFPSSRLSTRCSASLVVARMSLLVRRHEERGAELEEKGAELASELERRSYYDPLTGLPNRAFFIERLGEAIGREGDRRPP